MFPVAAAKNDHRLDGRKQQKLLISQFWDPKVQNQCHSVSMRYGQNCDPPETRGENPFLTSLII